MPEVWTHGISHAQPIDSRIVVGNGLLGGLPDLIPESTSAVALIGDATVVGLYGQQLQAQLGSQGRPCHTRTFQPGEAHKTRETIRSLQDWLLNLKADRQLCVVALGGGISLDVAGFVAATFLRGVPHLNVPTSLLAQVDASVGGKTGVNAPEGKNLIGAFHHPLVTVVDTDFLKTLPADQWHNGLAELIKHAVIGDAKLFDWCRDHATSLAESGHISAETLAQAIEVKARIVRRDPLEHNERAVLNFGHTIAHALEKASSHQIPHGLAVARGMVVEAALAMDAVAFPRDDFDALLDLLKALKMPLPATPGGFSDLSPYFASDKKCVAGTSRVALPCGLGRMAKKDGQFALAVEQSALERAWDKSAQAWDRLQG